MRRRDFIIFLAGGAAVAWTSAVRAQQKAMPVIGYLNGTTPEANAALLAAFRQGLGETGWAEGQNVVIEYRWAEFHFDRLPALAADLVGRKVSMSSPHVVVPVKHPQRNARPRRSRSSLRPVPTRSGLGWSPVSPGRVATLRAAPSSPSS
jgi:hypothetical protein